SCDVLGVGELEMLGYADSGMMGWPSNDAPGSFWRTPVEEGAARLADLMRHYRPDVVVTYDENGFYGHPDHIQAHRITMAALEMTGLTPKVYWTTMPHSGLRRFGEAMREFQEDLPEPDPAEADAMADIGLPDDEVTTWVDTTAFSGRKFDALAAHASQGENIFFLKMGKERFTELMGVETFVRVQDPTGAPVPENDPLAGLRGPVRPAPPRGPGGDGRGVSGPPPSVGTGLRSVGRSASDPSVGTGLRVRCDRPHRRGRSSAHPSQCLPCAPGVPDAL